MSASDFQRAKTNSAAIDQTHEEILAVKDAQLEAYRSTLKSIMSLGLPKELIPSDALDEPAEILKRLQENVSNIPPNHLNQIRNEATTAHESIAALENKVSYLDTTLHELKSEANETEVWLKEWNILIHGLKDIPRRPTDRGAVNNYEFHVIEYVCNKLNSLLGSKLYRRIVPGDIERAHKLYQGDKTSNPVIVVRFVRRVVRNNIFFNRKWLKNTRVLITDHLTKSNRELFYKAKEQLGRQNVWTTLGVVKAKVNGQYYEIRSQFDLENLYQPFQYRHSAQYQQNAQRPPPPAINGTPNVASHDLPPRTDAVNKDHTPPLPPSAVAEQIPCPSLSIVDGGEHAVS